MILYFEGNFKEIRKNSPDIVKAMPVASKYKFSNEQVYKIVDSIHKFTKRIAIP